MPYVSCPNCEAECLVIAFSTRAREHRCPQCGVSLAGARRVPSAALRLGNDREAQARFKRQPVPPERAG